MIRYANEIVGVGMPMYCSACFGQDAHLQHIDFDAEADRGYGDDKTMVMDNLILCENCVRRGGELIGMVDPAAQAKKMADLEEKVDKLTKAYTAAQGYAERLEGAFDARPQPIKLDHRSKPRKREATA